MYKRLGHRSIKTLLSSNKDEIWDDTEIKLQNDLVSTSDHYIATIQKRARNTETTPDTTLQPGRLLCLDLIKSPTKVGLTPDTTYKFYLLVVDGYSRLPQLAGLISTTTDDIINSLGHIRTQFYKIQEASEFLFTQRIQTDFGSAFTSDKFITFCRNNSITVTYAAPKHLEMNSILERTWQSICHIKNTLIVHARVDETCTHFALKAATDIFSVIPIRTLRKNGRLTTSYELFSGKKPKL